jgi:hypothetical protein
MAIAVGTIMNVVKTASVQTAIIRTPMVIGEARRCTAPQGYFRHAGVRLHRGILNKSVCVTIAHILLNHGHGHGGYSGGTRRACRCTVRLNMGALNKVIWTNHLFSKCLRHRKFVCD